MCLKVNMRVTGFVANCAGEDTNAHRLISLRMTRPYTLLT
jgi:hypothetical protein